MKKIFLSLLAFCALSASAQNNLVLGDMNNDGEVTIGDVSKVVSTALGQTPLQTIETCSCAPYQVDNTRVLGLWYKGTKEPFTFYEDGTTDWVDNATYEFYPIPGSLIIYNASGIPIEAWTVLKVTDETMVFCSNRYDLIYFQYYRQPHTQLVSSVILSHKIVTLNVNGKQYLTAVVGPGYADNRTVTYTSTNTKVATVDSNGLVTAVAKGTATISCTTTDGSNITAQCTVKVI